MEERTAVSQHDAVQQHLAWLPNCHLIKPASCTQQGTNKALEWPRRAGAYTCYGAAGVITLQLHPPRLITNTLVPSHLAPRSLLQATRWRLTCIVHKSVARYDLCPIEWDLQGTAEERIISVYLFIYPHSSFMNDCTYIHVCLYPQELSELLATYLFMGFTETSNYWCCRSISQQYNRGKGTASLRGM